MLMQILTRTPIFVWAILALLVYRGVASSRDRDVNVGALAIIPVLMLCLSAQAMLTSFGFQPVVLAAWLTASCAGLWTGWRLVDISPIRSNPATRTVRVTGSWMPMAMLMTIFSVKYVSIVSMKINPPIQADPMFASLVSGLLGASSAVLTGSALNYFASYRQAAKATPQLAPALAIDPNH